MGRCQNCHSSIRLSKIEENPVCPNCGENPYKCWNCQEVIPIDFRNECKICYYFECPKCHECGPKCRIHELEEECKRMMLAAQKNGNAKGVFKKIIRYVANELTSMDQLECFNGVGISYAHQKLKKLVLRMLGFHTKNDNDTNEFNEKFKTIEDKNIGEEWSVNEVRDDGTYGEEYRAASNLAICAGIARKKRKTINVKGKIISYDAYERVKKSPCKYANYSRINPMKCPKRKCGGVYDQGTKICPECGTELMEQKSHMTFCQLPRSDFVKRVTDIDVQRHD